MLEDYGWGHRLSPLGRMPSLYRHFAELPSMPPRETRWSKVDSGYFRADRNLALPMTYKAHRRFARREDLGLTRAEFAVLRRLSTPEKIQFFLNTICINHETGG